MKLFFFLLILPSLSFASGMKIFSMNLHCGLGDWQKRMEAVAEEILRVHPDVIGLQEVCYNDQMNMATYLRDRLTNGGYAVRTFRTVETHRSFLRFKEQLLVISRHKADEFTEGSLPGTAFLKNSYAALRIGKLWFVTTHLHFALASIRKNQYKALNKIYGDQPVILFGDLNSGPADRETLVLKEGEWVPFFDGPTYPAENPEKTFDGFWMSSSFHDEVLATTMERHFMNSRMQPSDHLGVSLYILFQ